MSTKTALHLAGAVIGAVLVALSLSGIAQAVTDTVFKYRTPQNGWYGVSGAQFRPENTATMQGSYFVAVNAISKSTSGLSCFRARVNLPQGVKITAFAAWYNAGTPAGVTVSLTRTDLTNGNTDTLASGDSTNANQTRKSMALALTSTAAFLAVNNQKFIYQAVVCLAGSDDLFSAGRITYTYASAGD